MPPDLTAVACVILSGAHLASRYSGNLPDHLQTEISCTAKVTLYSKLLSKSMYNQFYCNISKR